MNSPSGDWETAASNWGSTSGVIAASTNLSFTLVGIAPVIQTAVQLGTQLPVGRAYVDEVDLKLCIMNSTLNGVYGIGIGLYIADYDNTPGAFSSRDAYNARDCCRDDWIWYEHKAMYVPAAPTTILSSIFAFRQKVRCQIAQGKALTVVLTAGINSGSVSFVPFFRYRVKRLS